jgi:hypothetical protein
VIAKSVNADYPIRYAFKEQADQEAVTLLLGVSYPAHSEC